MLTRALIPLALLAVTGVTLLSTPPKQDPRLAGGERSAARDGWIQVRLAGTPAEIGFQHGYLLAPEIDDALKVTRLSLLHENPRSYEFYRTAAQRVFWPKVDEEYRQEMTGIVEGLAARGVKADLWDVVILNASLEWGYYTDWLDHSPQSHAPDRCSAFVATGSYTKDGQVVIAHNNWSGYLEGARWNIVFDIRPAAGHRFMMDGFPGMIHSGDDFGLNSAGIVITETTITQFHGFDPAGTPEFVRARKAMQYSASIDDFARLMTTGNNGGYANAWLVADLNRNEIGRLELGLKNVTLERSKDGYFTGANFPVNPKLQAEETTFPTDPGVSATARRARWEQLMAEWKGRIDVEAGKRFMADHYDAYDKKADSPGERTLCGHVELSPRGMKPWQDEFAPAGTVQSKITSTALGKSMTLDAAMGHSCGIRFDARAHLKAQPRYGWLEPLLRDLPGGPWARFTAK